MRPLNDGTQLLIIKRSSITVTDKKVVVEVRRCRTLVSPSLIELHHTCRVMQQIVRYIQRVSAQPKRKVQKAQRRSSEALSRVSSLGVWCLGSED